MSKAHTTKSLRNFKRVKEDNTLQMLTCYDFQTANMLNDTDLDLILVGDSLGNVILGYETTVEVTLNDMITFGAAVKRGAPKKFVVVDLPFGTYGHFEQGLDAATTLFQKTKAEAVKLEGCHPHHLELIKRLTENGIPVMGHIGLTPQSVHQMGGYYTHGKDKKSAETLYEGALKLQEAGVFSLVLECVEKSLSKRITDALEIPTIGIGSGIETDGQVLVINDLLKMGKEMPPKFCTPVADLFEVKKDLINNYLKDVKSKSKLEDSHDHHH
ncbi:MAG: 3-methyl-2-oxobutanoate hydroxymethyltransferase [Bacteriovoracaceae bacterium]|nr:3-methyl-2-oxobutanoate hydroxymethyltransferase [Bacteriovoracaceae bacterium]